MTQRRTMTVTGPDLHPLLLDRTAARRLMKAATQGLHGCHRSLVELGHHEIARAVSLFLEVDVTDLLAASWNGCDELVREARLTRQQPGLRSPVLVGNQTYQLAREGEIHISVEPLAPYVLPLRLDVEVELHGVKVILCDGGIAEIACGTATLRFSCFVQDDELGHWSHDIDLTMSVRLDPPLVLVAAPPPPPVEHPRLAR